MSPKRSHIFYIVLTLAALALISMWVDWNTAHRAEFNSMVNQADNFYENGDFEAAGAIYKELLSDHPRQRQLTAGHVSLIVFLAAAALFFAWLYFDKNRRLRELLSKSADAQAIPEVLNYEYDFSKARVSDDDAGLLALLRELFEEEDVYLDKNLTVDSLARMAGTSKVRMSHFINEVFGCNFPTLLSNYRVSRAVKMFSDPANDIYTIEAVGATCGFNNRQAFHSAFKKRVGMPPSRFRELIRKDN